VFYAIVSANTGTRRNRCSDRFVKYPYPKQLITQYKKEYPSKLANVKMLAQKDAFNYEKEHKIINPHKMEEGTTNKDAY
jgi:hypothetical protein